MPVLENTALVEVLKEAPNIQMPTITSARTTSTAAGRARYTRVRTRAITQRNVDDTPQAKAHAILIVYNEAFVKQYI